MKNNFITILLYIIGFICIIYPIYTRFLSYMNQTESIYDYQKELAIMEEKELEEKKKKAEEFNTNNSIDTNIIDSDYLDAKDENKISSYNFLDLGEMIGYINIPKINIELPIYEGVTTENLTKGVAHMENTSLPNGDLNTHSILAGHTGISRAEIFDNIDKLSIDDEFYITFYGTNTKYKVVDINIVLPENTKDLRIENDRCLVTLVTCTPKAVNTHRLLVKAEKVQNEEIEETNNNNDIINKEEVVKNSKVSSYIDFIKRNKIMFSITLIIIILLIILNVLTIIKRQKNKK